MTVSPLPVLIYDQHVRTALLEDLGRAGDLTSDLIIPKDLITVTKLVARQEGVVAGLDVAKCAFQLVDPTIRFEYSKQEYYDSDKHHLAEYVHCSYQHQNY